MSAVSATLLLLFFCLDSVHGFQYYPGFAQQSAFRTPQSGLDLKVLKRVQHQKHFMQSLISSNNDHHTDDKSSTLSISSPAYELTSRIRGGGGVLTTEKALANKLIPLTVTKGRNLYGRLPYDDWLFTDWKLISPDLNKKSYLETVLAEFPINRRKTELYELAYKTMVCAPLVLPLVTAYVYFLLKYKGPDRDALFRKDRERERAALGYHMPISANWYKGRFVNPGKTVHVGDKSFIDYSSDQQNELSLQDEEHQAFGETDDSSSSGSDSSGEPGGGSVKRRKKNGKWSLRKKKDGDRG